MMSFDVVTSSRVHERRWLFCHFKGRYSSPGIGCFSRSVKKYHFLCMRWWHRCYAACLLLQNNFHTAERPNVLQHRHFEGCTWKSDGMVTSISPYKNLRSSSWFSAAYSVKRATFSLTSVRRSKSIPFFVDHVTVLSQIQRWVAPSSVAFWKAWTALPEPEITTFLPAKLSALSISSV